MLKTLIVLPDGTELFSGAGTKNAIQEVTITECVNEAQELSLGSVCASMVEAKIITPAGGISLTAGDEIAVYKVDDAGTRHAVGLFTTEKPTRPSANRMSITAYDRISWFDKDLSMWLYNLDGWPYSLFDFACMVCEECGLALKNTEIPNGSYMVQAFSGEGITGRQLMRWVGQIAGRFCRAATDGTIELAWYTPISTCKIEPDNTPSIAVSHNTRTGNLSIRSEEIEEAYDDEGNLSISSELLTVEDDGNGNLQLVISERFESIPYFQNGLSFEDYTVAAIRKVQLRQNEEDLGTVYPPDMAEAANTYTITGNYLLTASTGEDLTNVAKNLYEHLQDVSYTPCKVAIPARMDIRAGSIVGITDINGKQLSVYVMMKTQRGQTDTLECTGSPSRGSSTAINNQSYAALTGKVLNLRTDVDGLKVENRDFAGQLASVKLELDGITTTVETQEEEFGKRISEINQSAREISAKIQSIQENGAEKVTTEFGLTIDESAVTIHRAGSEMTNRLNEEGMYVVRGEGSSGETIMLKADAKGVIATDVSVRNYLIVGTHARFEDYNNGKDSKRTACFWLEG